MDTFAEHVNAVNAQRAANEARWLTTGTLNAQETADYLDFIRDYIKAGDWRSAGEARQEIVTKTGNVGLSWEIYDTAKHEATKEEPCATFAPAAD